MTGFALSISTAQWGPEPLISEMSNGDSEP